MEFEMTTKGYKKARDYLEGIGKLKEFEKELSTDGFSLIYYANSIREKRDEDIK